MRFLVALTFVSLAVSCSSADNGGQTGEEQRTAAENPAATQQALMTRWNDAVDAAGTSIDFHWSSVDNFPHPTFKMGTDEAYQQFADILVLFFQRDFDFLSQKHLFQTHLRYVFPSGQVGMDTSFQELATNLSTPNYMIILPATREALKAFLDRM